MSYDIKKAGLRRANPNASERNTLRLVHPTAPGTAAVDTSTASVAARQYTGIVYDGNFIPFADREQVGNALKEKTVQVIAGHLATGAERLRQAIADIVERFEVDPVVEIAIATTNFTFKHIGAGTLSAVAYDGGTYALTRAAITEVGVVSTTEAPPTEGDEQKISSPEKKGKA